MAACLCRRVLTSNFGVYRRIIHYNARRTLLNPSYSCDEAWKQRLETPVLGKVDVGEFAMKVQEKLDKEGKASAIDIDILANKLEQMDSIQLDFVQTLFFRFRKCKEATHIQESTHYALIRALLQFEDTERLLEMLEDKVNYGIFLDNFTANMVLDHFLEKEDWQASARIAVDLMFQEDFTHPLTRALSWYACHKAWKNPPEVSEVTEDADQDDDEVWVKVDFITNPHYDDHWDIPRMSQRIGKTLTMVAGGQDSLLSRTYQLIGWGLYEKFDKGLELLSRWAESDIKEVVNEAALSSFGKSLEEVVTREPAEAKEPGLVTLDDVTPYYTQEEKDAFQQRFQGLADKLRSQGNVADVDLEPVLLAHVKKVQPVCEEYDIQEQTSKFQEWNHTRLELLEKELQEVAREQKKEEIALRLKALRDREEKLRYFDQKDQIRLGMSRAPEVKPIKQVTEEEVFVQAPHERGRTV